MSTPTALTKPYHLIGAWPRYSGWTARVVIILEHLSLSYTTDYYNITTFRANPLNKGKAFPTPTGLLPSLVTRELDPPTTLHDSLAILEYLAETYPDAKLWPEDKRQRALARCICAEFHSGFSELREKYPVAYVARYKREDVPEMTEKARKELNRLFKIWDEARGEIVGKDGDKGFLFGEFGIADAFFWPVLWRIRTYDLPIEEASDRVKTWVEKMWKHEAVKKMDQQMFEHLKIPESVEKELDNLWPERIKETGVFEEGWEYRAA